MQIYYMHCIQQHFQNWQYSKLKKSLMRAKKTELLQPSFYALPCKMYATSNIKLNMH